MARRERPLVLYPAYFDVGRSRAEGRRVPKGWAVPEPRAERIADVVRALGLKATLEPEKALSPTPWRRDGRVLVEGETRKSDLLRRVAERLRSDASAPR